MDKKFCLEDKREEFSHLNKSFCYLEEDIKQAIKLLKEEICGDKNTECLIMRCRTQGENKDGYICDNCEKIEKIFGKGLCDG